MFSAGQLFSVTLTKPIILTDSPPSKHLRHTRHRQFTTQCTNNLHSATNPFDPAAVAASVKNFTFTGPSKNRTDLQTSCAIISSTIIGKQHDNENRKGIENITVVNAERVLDLELSGNIRKPLTINDMSTSPMHGSEIRVVYQGVPGAYSETAAAKAYPNGEFIPCEQFEQVFQAVELWIADRAVLPLENSLGGSVHRTYDLLLRHRLHIVGEVQLPVRHCLLALPGVNKQDLNRVISHPQALAQCELTLTKLDLKITRESSNSTAGAAELISESNLRNTAAIGSERAAKIYGLNVLVEGIHDDCNNFTRFLMLAREPIIPRIDQPFRTSIVFAHDNGTSVLFKVLSVFAFRNINLTKIESRPHRLRPITIVGSAKRFEYLFYVDFDASMADVRAQNALSDVQEFTTFLRVLGSYPVDMTPLCSSGGD
ncbi:hypothetical protein QVD17_14915 [Tagetes erecta]|uniref:Arogenate dehydratase n=1 Tax=Tagetes erecta TaxID=13708 RepID=A0AAD8KNB2_TARER|nr:hypothetical protein QVD17_14915 [Tagetes erecta]